jgi:peptidoglycan/xylan/chitin deacetylase (PgdA/CDA1 family)
LLTFDLEEFDIPLEYGSQLPWEEQIAVGRAGMERVSEVLKLHKVPTTIFTTAAYALENESQLQQLSEDHEIASHSYYHSSYHEEDLGNSKLALEKITGKEVFGLRMPRMKEVPMDAVLKAGYAYDSSINPTFIPGKYNNLHLPKSVYRQENVTRVPCSVSPTLRVPLFWLAFKNFPYSLYKKLAVQTLHSSGFLNLYFHPWEFTDISKYKLPGYVKRHSGKKLLERLDQLIKDLEKEGAFDRMHNFLKQGGYL